MITLFQQLGRFLNNMDSKAMTSALVTLALFAFVTVMLVYGTDWLGINQHAVNDIMYSVEQSPFALIGLIAVFSALALTGFPQTLLIAGTVAVFGAQQGAIYSWIATMCSATLTFILGHAFGGRFVRKLSAGRAATMIKVMQEHGLLASMIVRWTPSAPFIVINSICGAAHIPFWKFGTGTGIGILPKILFISIFTHQVDDIVGFFQSRNLKDLIVIGSLIAGWIIFLLVVRWLYRRLRNSTLQGLDSDA
ncbi:VTT domain-containing protein [Parvularcula sp. LCG005]|uniref:TVP38/TMEM64 family protein n=1 Tax=Parvularcula sp. LCG005 TaxID=3078805 RepID=UPI002943B8CB|nr:VTT domain-containing protein [Parvularcula sp. LCG005]WOI54113.1 VTT domain-containing protein [Parvularcula sp. LCG005]